METYFVSWLILVPFRVSRNHNIFLLPAYYSLRQETNSLLIVVHSGIFRSLSANNMLYSVSVFFLANRFFVAVLTVPTYLVQCLPKIIFVSKDAVKHIFEVSVLFRGLRIVRVERIFIV